MNRVDKTRLSRLISELVYGNPKEVPYEDIKFVLESLGFMEGKSKNGSVVFSNNRGQLQIIPKIQSNPLFSTHVEPVTRGVIQQIVDNLELEKYVSKNR